MALQQIFRPTEFGFKFGDAVTVIDSDGETFNCRVIWVSSIAMSVENTNTGERYTFTVDGELQFAAERQINASLYVNDAFYADPHTMPAATMTHGCSFIGHYEFNRQGLRFILDNGQIADVNDIQTGYHFGYNSARKEMTEILDDILGY